MFKEKIKEIRDQIDKFTNNKNLLMTIYIQRKLDRSLDNYLKEIELNINYLLYRDPKKVKKWLNKQIDKGEI